jgi:hypothetical protein
VLVLISSLSAAHMASPQRTKQRSVLLVNFYALLHTETLVNFNHLLILVRYVNILYQLQRLNVVEKKAKRIIIYTSV